MKYDIIKAVTEYYKNDEDIMADCLIYLKNTTPMDFGLLCVDRLLSKHRCVNCGCKMIEHTYQEYHPEIEGDIRFETMRELVCPNCDFS